VGFFLVREAHLISLKPLAGVVSDDTELASKGRYSDADKVRFRGGLPETISGWSAFNASGVASGKARGAHAWTTLDGERVYAAASETAVYAWIGGSRTTITPRWMDVWLDDCFTCVSGSSTYTCTFKPLNVATGSIGAAQNHFLLVGQSVTFSNGKQTVGGRSMNITATITAVSGATFTFTHPTGNATGTEATPVGEQILLTVAFKAGLATGTANTAIGRPRIYTMDNFGEELVFCGSDGTPIWCWQPELAYNELITNGDFASATGWAAGGDWNISGGAATNNGSVEGILSQAVAGVLEPGRVYELSFQTTSFVANGQLTPLIDSVEIFPTIDSSISNDDDFTTTWTARFVCPPNPQNLSFAADANGGGNITIDNVSVKLEDTAYPLSLAPQKNYACFVDANRILIALGSVEADGDFNATLIRWCDQENLSDWTPDTDNLAGEYPVGKGNYFVGGAVVGERNLVLTDDGAHVMAFTGSPGSVYSIVPVAQACGLIGANAIASYGGKAFWASMQGFHAFDGTSVLSIECPMKDRFVNKLPDYQSNKTFSFINSEFGEVWFCYPHEDDGTEVSRYLTFAFIDQDNPWSCGTLNRTIMTRAGTFEFPIGVDTSGNVWYHETGTSFSGTGITLPYIETAWLTGKDGDQWSGCRRYVPDIEGQVGNIEWTCKFKRRPQGQLNTTTLGPYLVIPNQEKVDFLGRGRQVKMRWESATSTTKWRIGVIGLEMLFDQEIQ
jgi:hypothetical protein